MRDIRRRDLIVAAVHSGDVQRIDRLVSLLKNAERVVKSGEGQIRQVDNGKMK